MNVQEFVDEYNKQPDEEKKTQLIKAHIKKYYIPFGIKVNLCKSIIETSCYKNGIFVEDSPSSMFILIMKALSMYTDIDFNGDNVLDNFDKLGKEQLSSKIIGEIGTDFDSLKAVFDMTVTDARNNENSIVHFINEKILQLSDTINSEDFKKYLSGINLKLEQGDHAINK